MAATSILDQQIAAYSRTRTCGDQSTLCHAPSRAMHFGRDGFVTACSSSRATAFGSWPNKSVEELWFGSQSRNAMCEALARNTLPGGCGRCADQLRAGSFTSLQASKFDSLARAKPARDQRVYPSRMDFELSNKCNLECIQCSGFLSSSIRSNRENLPPLPASYDARFVEQLKPFIPHLTEAKFLGGEPFLIDIYYDVWELFIELNPGCLITIISNGTVFTPKVQRILDNLNCDIIVSLDSLQKETNEAIRRNSNFERMFANLESIIAVNASHARNSALSVSPMIANWREMPAMISWATQRNLRVYFTTVVNPKELSLRNASPDTLDEVVETYTRAPRMLGGKLAEQNNNAFDDLRLHVTMWRDDRKTVKQVESGYQDLHNIQPAATPNPEISAVELQRAQVRRHCKALAEQPCDRTPTNLALLHALAQEFPDIAELRAILEQDPASTPFERTAAYLTAIWEVGDQLRPYAILSGTDFTPQRLAAYLDFHNRAFSPARLAQMYEFSIQRPYHVLAHSALGSIDDSIALLTRFFVPDTTPTPEPATVR